jgi:type IV pilus assembly protein PilW
LMVSMTIGLLLMGAMYSAYIASVSIRRSSLAVTQMAEDASVALGLLKSHLGMAGFSRPVEPGSGQQWRRAATDTGHWLFGCDGKFVDLSVGVSDLRCDASGANATDSVAVAYEADSSNSLTRRVSGQDVPMDCLGNAIDMQSDGRFRYYLAYSRFYVAQGGLYCRGPGAPGGQVLVENVADLQLSYGVAPPGGGPVRSYLSARAVTTAAAWSRVLSVRICLVVRSADEVLPEVTPYQGCDSFAEPSLPVDRRAYRAFVSTALLHNRIGGDL